MRTGLLSLYPGQAPEEVEKKVTIPVERALFGVPNVLVQRSISSFGLSQVIVTFEDGVDIYFARQQVVIIDGLISSTLLTLLVLPTLYELFDRWFGSGRTRREPSPAS